MNVHPEYRFQTECGRNMVWSAIDEEWIERYAASRGYRIVPGTIELYTEYDHEVEMKEQQEKLNHEIDKGAA